MWRERRPIIGRGDYILVSDWIDYLNVSIKNPRMTTNHRMVLPSFGGAGHTITDGTNGSA